ncbi:MAG: ComEA family DNA-binding protein [Candidatus Udaeobacter sp.]
MADVSIRFFVLNRKRVVPFLVSATLLFSFACTRHQHTGPSVVAVSAPASDDEPATTLLNINTATKEELEKLPGIGPTTAQKIIEHREKYGPFKRIEHLLIVKGISDKVFREIYGSVTVR